MVHAQKGPITPIEISRELQRRLCRVCQVATVIDARLMWRVVQGVNGGSRACHRKKAVGEPYEGKPHVWFDVAGDGNRDRVEALRHSQRKRRETGLSCLSLGRHSLTLQPDAAIAAMKGWRVGGHRSGWGRHVTWPTARLSSPALDGCLSLEQLVTRGNLTNE